LSAQRKLTLYTLILAEIATQRPDLAQLLESEFLKAANYLPLVAADLFVESFRSIILMFPDFDAMKAQLVDVYSVTVGRAVSGQAAIMAEAYITLDSLLLCYCHMSITVCYPFKVYWCQTVTRQLH